MRRIALSLMLSAACALAACTEEKPAAPVERTGDAAAAVAEAESKAKAANEAEKQSLEAELKSAKSNQQLHEIFNKAGKYPDIKKQALAKLEADLGPKVATAKWAELDAMMEILPSSSSVWLAAYNRKEELRAATKK